MVINIEDLNYECISAILSHVTLKDRFNVEKVSKTLEYGSEIAWKDLGELTWHGHDQSPEFNLAFHKSGPYLKKVTLRSISYTYGNGKEALKNIMKYCGDNLEYLEITDTHHHTLTVMKKWKNLRTLKLGDLKATDSFMEILTQNVTLTHLELEYVQMSNYSAKLISNLINLEHLNVREARNEIQDDAMSSILNNCKKLKELNIMNANVLSKYIVIEPASLIELEHLSVACRPRTSDTVMNYIFMNCKNLKSIHIGNGEYLSNKTLNILGDLKNLKSMLLSRAAIDDSVLYHYHDLKVLDCAYCPKITDSGIKHILDSSPNLEKLRVESTNVTLRTLSYALYLSTCRKKKLRLGLSSHIKVNPESTNDIDIRSVREKFNNEYFELIQDFLIIK